MTVPLFALSTQTALILGGAALAVAGLAVLGWLVVGRGPRRRRAYTRGRKALSAGQWEDALAVSREILQTGALSPLWEGRVHNLQGESHYLAGDADLKDRQYESALAHYTTAAQLLGQPEKEARARVFEAMLTESHRLYAAGPAQTAAVEALLDRLLRLEPASTAGTFWRGLCHARAGRLDQAVELWQKAHEGSQKTYIDPPLYLGMARLRQGRPQEALRHLADANRIDASCPFVPLHMGLALVAAEGDAGLAVRALQRAIGPRGLSKWVKAPAQAWTDGLPEGKSFVRRLAVKANYVCPLVGGELTPLLHEAQYALGEALGRLGQHQESADVYARLLQESAPSPRLLRAHGLALVRQEKYDQAYKQLRIALDADPNHARTAGYLALCGALGKPTAEGDRPRNVAWAVKQVSRFEIYGDPEWASLCSRIFAEARALGLPQTADEQVRLCDVLASVFATDPTAAAAYEHLAFTAPDALRSEHAWIWCRAAQEHGVTGRCDLLLFSRTFQEADQARPFYLHREWDFDTLEYAYLERSAKSRPGRFPDELGPDGPTQATALLLDRVKARREAGDMEGALAAAEVLFALAPTNVASHDTLARLHHARGNAERAVALLAGWHRLEPGNPLPLIRRAVIEQERGHVTGREEALRLALERTHGRARSAVALLGAKLVLASVPDPSANGQPQSPLHEAERLVEQSLWDDPGRPEALLLLAAIKAVEGDRERMASLSPVMNQPQVTDPRFHYLAAACHLAAGAVALCLETCRLAWSEADLTAECRYLMGWARLHQGDPAGAVREWEVVARTADSASAPHARALLGRLRAEQGDYDDALQWWTDLTPADRERWSLDEPLRQTAFVAGLIARADGRPADAAERFREAGRLGLRDRRLGPLLVQSLVEAGQQALAGEAVVEGGPVR